MDIIRVLDKQTSDLIAAGEVVERPSSVVKELVENSIDAGATSIKIEIEKGGAALIRVTDNGKGMTSGDAVTAFLKHATSKLHTKDDLYAIGTLGFRGEALCAIAAVSEVTLRTKTADETEGTLLVLSYGETAENKSIAYVTGTSISVENLFANVPARLKFLKSEAAETASISAVVETIALAFPSVAFSYSVNGKEKLFTYGKGSLKDALLATEGKEFAENMLQVSVSSPYGTAGKRIAVSGFTGKPLYNRPSRLKQLFYINNRMIRSRIMQNALENGYRSYIMTGRFPVCVLNLTIPFEDVDINVHPGKLEAKFGDEKAVYDIVLAAVTLALSKDSSSPEMKYLTAVQPSVTVNESIRPQPAVSDNTVKPEPTVKPVTDTKTVSPSVSRADEVKKLISSFEKRTDEQAVRSYGDWTIMPSSGIPSQPKKKSVSVSAEDFDDTSSAPAVKAAPSPEESAAAGELTLSDITDGAEKTVTYGNVTITPPENDSMRSVAVAAPVPESPAAPVDTEPQTVLYEAEPSYSFIGECFGTYIILEVKNELLFIDKHALHERMNFERLKAGRTHESQTLLSPLLITLDGDGYSSVISRKDFLYGLGFDVDDFGSGTVAVRAIPEILTPGEAESVLCSFADTLTSDKGFADAELLDSFIYDIACKASVKAGSESSEEELKALVCEYMKNKDRLRYCPHGRPITVTISKTAIEKNFKRLV